MVPIQKPISVIKSCNTFSQLFHAAKYADNWIKFRGVGGGEAVERIIADQYNQQLSLISSGARPGQNDRKKGVEHNEQPKQ